MERWSGFTFFPSWLAKIVVFGSVKQDTWSQNPLTNISLYNLSDESSIARKTVVRRVFLSSSGMACRLPCGLAWVLNLAKNYFKDFEGRGTKEVKYRIPLDDE